ncbi:sulfotransferase family 2 domain-containing protein [Salipiger mucosus]|uniref:Sulfotransferase family protein n=1 Tax=Salipiger mucosus DSM 16094 TaxID=1123237 RepID=S9Q6A9_9RHOB|nr:sulfotransferase family 2 domain-containing protein [Salipiger mucosus]EPX75552.1 hypothetical protein Salmuc_03186 [Salipiger mucosus DSM 16094]
MNTVVFLHIPKTAGQTIHAELARTMGKKAVSPVRVHTQAGPGAAQLPPGYRLYSGHIDWEALETLPEPRFVFTVLRDPLERIASFYFYLRRKADTLSAEELERPEHTGMRMAATLGPDDYFFGGKPGWKRFIRDHYDSPYCTYLVTRKIRGFAEIADLPAETLAERAETEARKLDGVYSVDALDALERDLKDRCGLTVRLAGHYVNAGDDTPGARRWPKLEAMLEREETLEGLRGFARADQLLMTRLGLA